MKIVRAAQEEMVDAKEHKENLDSAKEIYVAKFFAVAAAEHNQG